MEGSDNKMRQGQGREKRGREKPYFFRSRKLLACTSAHKLSPFLIFLLSLGLFITLKKKYLPGDS